MQKISDLKSYNIDVRLEWDEANDQLVFYADNGWVCRAVSEYLGKGNC